MISKNPVSSFTSSNFPFSLQNSGLERKFSTISNSGDGSAEIYHLFAGIIMAAQSGLEMPDALQRAEELYVDINIFKEENKKKTFTLEQLPASCSQSPAALENDRHFFERNNIILKRTMDRFIKDLRSYEDEGLSEKLYGKDDKTMIDIEAC